MTEKSNRDEVVGSDIGIAIQVIREAIYRRIYAVRCGIDTESPTFYMSRDWEKRNKQLCFRWKSGAAALVERRVPYEPSIVDRRIVLPALRRLHILVTEPDLLRFIETLDRLRTGVLEILAERSLDEQFSCPEGAELARGLLLALVNYDMKTLATLLPRVNDLAPEFAEVLGLTTAEQSIIKRLGANEEWDDLGEGEEPFGRVNLARTA